MSELCRWLHEQIEPLGLIDYKVLRQGLETLPVNGIYFFYEEGELWGHGGNKQRIVRVGTHRDGNFRSRIAEHYLLDEARMNFDKNKPKPSDRSIFRKNIGRALLNKEHGSYLKTWEIDFMHHNNKVEYAKGRDIEKEQEIERKITEILRSNFRFRFIELANQKERMDRGGIESALIGTLAQCPQCRASDSWLGKSSPKTKICNGKLWLVQHLRANSINEIHKKIILEAMSKM
jgi:hypothetical protein